MSITTRLSRLEQQKEATERQRGTSYEVRLLVGVPLAWIVCRVPVTVRDAAGVTVAEGDAAQDRRLRAALLDGQGVVYRAQFGGMFVARDLPYPDLLATFFHLLSADEDPGVWGPLPQPSDEAIDSVRGFLARWCEKMDDVRSEHGDDDTAESKPTGL